MAASLSRMGSANTFDTALRNLSNRQSTLANLQENLTSGKKVVRASDDPTAAAQAERAMTRISRIAADQRALESQRNAISMAEGTLGDVTDAMQSFRELVVNAGDGVHTAAERKTIAIQLQGLRDQIFSLANRKDTNGLPLFSALGSALAPFVGPQATAPDYTFNGLPGQSASSEVAIPFTLDGDGAFMHQPARDQVFNAVVSTIPGDRILVTNNVTVTDSALVNATAAAASLATGVANSYPTYTLTFGAVTPDPVNPLTSPSSTSYTITDDISGVVTAPVTLSFIPGKSVNIQIPDPATPNDLPGLSFTITGIPAENDTITIDASPSIFSVLDNAIKDIGGAANNNGATQAVSQALNNIDIGMGRVAAVRGKAGDLLNRADRITSNQEARSIQLEADRSSAQDLDMIKGIADFQNQQTGYQAALQTYAQVQKLSLFNYIG